MTDPAALAALAVAFASACGFALSTSLQHRSAGQAPASVQSSAGVLRFVVTKPAWLLGIIIGAVAFIFHAIALKLGAIALVQPVMITGVVLAVPVRTALDRSLPSKRELRSVLITALGLATFLVVANPVPSADPPDRRAALLGTLLCLGLAAVMSAAAARAHRPRPQALLLGVSAGVLFGVVAGLLKLVVGELGHAGPAELLFSWPPWALVGAGVCGMAINQRAYQIAPLSLSMPVLNIVDVLVALGLGAWAFGEAPAHSPLALVVQAAALACMAFGLQQIARTHDVAQRPQLRHEPTPGKCLMTVVAAGFLGLMTGLHTATWGAYKDSPFEGFKWASYLRSVILGCGIAVGIALTTTWASDLHPLVLVGLFYTGERLATEWWKTIVRDDDQAAYTIPMRLGFRGLPVNNRLIRYTVGAAVVAGLILACAAATSVQQAAPSEPHWATILIGGVGGWLTAAGGAWKDAPIEGFSAWKFMRSPVIATAWALPLSFLTADWAILAFCAGGFSVASIETYKTFFTGGRPPGKFATKAATHRLPRLRPFLAVQHTGCWMALAILLGSTALPVSSSAADSGTHRPSGRTEPASFSSPDRFAGVAPDAR